MNKQFFKETSEITEFAKSCLSRNESIMALWKKSKTIDEFKEKIKNDDTLKFTQGAAELLKGDWYFLRSFLGDKRFYTYSDAGGVKVGNNDFSIIIPNGYGDGETRVAVFEERDKFNTSAFNFFTSINADGETNIYNHDCGNEIERKLDNGRYGIYQKDGIVIFERWD